MVGFRTRVASSAEHPGSAGTYEPQNIAGHGSAPISPASLTSSEALGFPQAPPRAAPAMPAFTAGKSQQSAQAGTPPRASGKGTVSAVEQWQQPDATAASTSQELEQVRSQSGLNSPTGWAAWERFVGDLFGSSSDSQPDTSATATSHTDASSGSPLQVRLPDATATSTPQELQQIGSQLGLNSPQGWAAWERFVKDTVDASSGGRPDASAAVAQRTAPSSGSQSTVSAPPAIPRVHPSKILERAATQPRDRMHWLGLRYRQPTPLLYNTHVSYLSTRQALREYVETFLDQYGYDVEVAPSREGQSRLLATNRDTKQTFYVFPKRSATDHTERPLLSPQGIPNVLAVVNNNAATPSLMGRVYLIRV